MQVNGNDAEPGCYIDGHRGQYGLDMLADVCEQFEVAILDSNDTRMWRRLAEAENVDDATYAGKVWRPEDAWEQQVWAADALEAALNDATTGGYWSWEDGEFFLTQTEVERTVVCLGNDYDNAWHRLMDGADIYGSRPLGAAAENVHEFRITIHYEPED